MLLLLETAAGYALFKVKDASLENAEAKDIATAMADEATAKKSLSLKAFQPFRDTQTALEETAELVEGKLGPKLKKFLTKTISDKQTLGVLDKELGKAIGAADKLKKLVKPMFSESVSELLRAARMHAESMVRELAPSNARAMRLGLAHSLTRHKLKFSADKVDVMIIQAVGLLDDLDKEVNQLAMRLREWYGWHFPELGKIVTDSLTYARLVQAIGMRSSVKTTDWQALVADGRIALSEDICSEIAAAAEVSMGTEITEEDLLTVQILCARVADLMEYRSDLADYLRQRMQTIAPNLTYMVGELIGARLISHAGSLMSLAKHASSTVQMLGAEKALFRALKAKKNTPKYGLIYHASIVGQAAPKLKGKVSRALAAKLSMSARVDALTEGDTDVTVGKDMRAYMEKRLSALEDQAAGKSVRRGAAPAGQARASTASGGGHDTGADATRAAKRPRQG